MNKERLKVKIENLIYDNTWFEVTGKELELCGVKETAEMIIELIEKEWKSTDE